VATSDWKPGDPIGYLRPERPEVDIPAYSGQRYETLVPDTLDLQERAALAIHAMTECTNPAADYEVYWHVNINANPPKMSQNSWQGNGVSKFQEALVLNRLMSGSDQNLHVDRRWMEVMLQSQGPDGLIYSPLRGRPWVERELPKVGVSYESGQYVTPFGNGRTLSAMSVFARRDGGPLWRDAARGVAEGLVNLAVDAGDYAFFWPSSVTATRDYPAGVTAPRQDDHQSKVADGLVHAYRLLGYEPALHLARKLLIYTRRTYFTPDGTFLSQPGDTQAAHFHGHGIGLKAMEEYAEVSGDEEMMQFALRGFEFAKRVGGVTNPDNPRALVRGTPGANLIGFFPELVDTLGWMGSETCDVSDMIALALRFSEAGVGDFWDDADRWARNMLAEGQLLATDWMPRFSAPSYTVKHALSAVGEHETTDRVPERNLGAFAGWPAPNDWYTGHGRGTAHCCTANGARVLYWLWDRIVRYHDGKLRVNLLLNRASKWADVDSYIPYQGRVELTIKQPVELSVRIPEWVKPDEARCQVNGADRGVTWSGRYAQVGGVKPSDVVTLSFPIFERTDLMWIERQAYTLVRKGNEVVSIDPPGRYCPLFQRQHYRGDSPRWRRMTRFVSDGSIEW